jgi:signal transduction histidine kinase
VRENDSERPYSSAKRGHVVRTGSYNALGDSSAQQLRERRTAASKPNLLAAPGRPEKATPAVPNADVLGFALDCSSSLHGSRPEEVDGFPFLEEDFLLQLTRKYPSGTIWLFRENGSLSTPTDDEVIDGRLVMESASPTKRNHDEHRKAEAAALRSALPQARQILFAPLFEAELSRATAGCLAFTTDVTRILSPRAELGFIKSFVNSIGAQVARINAIAADKSKNAFIGSISHELRSPLHGILAAAEFLEDTSLDTYQKSLISTQVSCGKTLLQVIEHVLDYSKINSFEKVTAIATSQLTR